MTPTDMYKFGRAWLRKHRSDMSLLHEDVLQDTMLSLVETGKLDCEPSYFIDRLSSRCINASEKRRNFASALKKIEGQ